MATESHSDAIVMSVRSQTGTQNQSKLLLHLNVQELSSIIIEILHNGHSFVARPMCVQGFWVTGSISLDKSFSLQDGFFMLEVTFLDHQVLHGFVVYRHGDKMHRYNPTF